MNQIKVGLIGGSGLAAVVAGETRGTINVIDTPFGRPSGPIVETDWGGVPIFFLPRHGAKHVLGPSQVPYRANIFALKKLGVTHIIASGAVGSLREEYRPRDLVIPDQIIDKTRRDSTFFEQAAVHVEYAEPFCPVLRQILVEAGQANTADATDTPSDATTKILPTVHDGGCYVAMEGPAFSTRAESLMHRLWGGDLIGMTLMPEAKLAREAEISYAHVSLVTDYDCWKKRPLPPAAGDGKAEGESSGAQPAKADPFELLNEIIANLQAASDSGVALIKKAVSLIAADPARLADCPAHAALQLAIWSDKLKVSPTEVARLAPLWVQYFR